MSSVQVLTGLAHLAKDLQESKEAQEQAHLSTATSGTNLCTQKACDCQITVELHMTLTALCCTRVPLLVEQRSRESLLLSLQVVL